MLLFSETFASETDKYTLPSLSMVTITTSFWGAVLVDTELGVTTVSASGGLNLVARIKKESNRKATSHIAVMSMFVLFLGNFALPIFLYLDAYYLKFHKSVGGWWLIVDQRQ